MTEQDEKLEALKTAVMAILVLMIPNVDPVPKRKLQEIQEHLDADWRQAGYNSMGDDL